jgi:hypothetical protein
MHDSRYTILTSAFLIMLALPMPALAAQHPNFSQFASPITGYTINVSAVTFPTNQSTGSFLINITDIAIYRYVNMSFNGNTWIQRSFSAGTPASCLSIAGESAWLTGTCTLTVPMAAANFSFNATGISKLRNYVTAFSCTALYVSVPLIGSFRIGWDCHGSASNNTMWQIRNYSATLPCTPNCAGRECGSDGCGGSCGSCSVSPWTNTSLHASFACNASYLCVPTCNSGWGNCDVGRANGCEGNLTTNQYCGNCTNACASQNYCLNCTAVTTGVCAGYSGLQCLAQSGFQPPPSIPNPP